MHKAGLQGVKRSRLSETLGLTPEEVETLCARLDKMPGRSYEDEIFKKPEHKWLGRGGVRQAWGGAVRRRAGKGLLLQGACSQPGLYRICLVGDMQPRPRPPPHRQQE